MLHSLEAFTNEKFKPVILCVDDEPVVRYTLNLQLLNKFGDTFIYEFAESAEHGLRLADEMRAKGHSIVMVISDQIMPGMYGDQLLTKIQESDPKSIKMLLTGRGDLDSAINAVNKANLYRYFTKPWDEEELLFTIESGLMQYYLNDEIEFKNRNIVELSEVFRRFVPDQIQRRIANEGTNRIDPGAAEDGNATILFSDFRSFTTIAESMSPKDTLRFINDLMSPMIPVIHSYDGFINQFIGDAIMAIYYFQQAGDADRALQSAIAMQDALAVFNGDNPYILNAVVRMGIGLNTGKIITGTIGDHNRMEAAVIGDTVNLAARLEALTKYYGSGILISSYTMNGLTDPSRYRIRPMDFVRVQGKTRPVEVFEVFDADPPDLKEQKTAIMADFIEGLQLFRSGLWQPAEACFEKCLEICPQDMAVQLYITRCRNFKFSPPPEDWDGAINMRKAPN